MKLILSKQRIEEMKYNKNKTIGLYGIGGFYNNGCEAIVRGTVIVLRSIVPDCKIIYYSRRAEEDRSRVADLDIEIVQISNPTNIVKRVINKCLRIIHINYRIPSDNYKQICDEAEVIILIGGDIYTIPAHIRDSQTYEYYNNLVQFGEYAKRRSKSLIIFGASIGPFGEYEKAKEYYFKHLKKVDIIVCRENNTIDYLKKNGINRNLIFYPDPAFFVFDKQSNVDETEIRYIGINLSPLSLSEIYGDVTIVQKQKLADLISSIAKCTKRNILLIPHVISPVNQMDNDLSFLTEIHELFNNDIKESVKLLNNAGGFIQTKNYLHLCDIVIAARMHCAINAMCEAIPSILLSYSEKSKGVAKFVYGNDNWVLSFDELETHLLDKINQMLDQRDEIHSYLEERIEDIRSGKVHNETLNKFLKVV